MLRRTRSTTVDLKSTARRRVSVGFVHFKSMQIHSIQLPPTSPFNSTSDRLFKISPSLAPALSSFPPASASFAPC